MQRLNEFQKGYQGQRIVSQWCHCFYGKFRTEKSGLAGLFLTISWDRKVI